MSLQTHQRTLGNKLHSKVSCVCTLKCNLGYNIDSDVFFVINPDVKYTKILLEEHQLVS